MLKNTFRIRNILPTNFFKSPAIITAFTLFPLSLMSFTPDYAAPPELSVKNYINYSDTTKGFISLFGSSKIGDLKSLFIEINPKAMPFVDDFLKRESKAFEKMKDWGKPYFNLFDKILADNSLPTQLKYLAVVESHLRPKLVSWAGALGPWQLMPAEAKRLGLKITRSRDERTDFIKSTQGAAKLLKELYAQYGDWLLVVAAYNSGCGGLDKAIKKSGSKDFWKLQYSLPVETRNHVKKFIATHYFFEEGGSIATMTASETRKFQQAQEAVSKNATLNNTSIVKISGRYNPMLIAEALAIPVNLFDELNPGLDAMLLQGKDCDLRLPDDKLQLFASKKDEILQQSVQLLMTSGRSALN